MTVKKKQILTATLMVALAAAVAVNWYYTRSDVVVTPDSSSQTQETTLGNLGDSLYVAGRVSNQSASEETTTEDANQTEPLVSDKQFFASARLKREESNDEISDEIENILESDNLSSEDKAKITALMTQYQEIMKAQTDAENLITAKLSCDCVVIIKDGSAQVILPSGILNETVLLQITDIFEKNTNISSENLTIIEAK